MQTCDLQLLDPDSFVRFQELSVSRLTSLQTWHGVRTITGLTAFPAELREHCSLFYFMLHLSNILQQMDAQWTASADHELDKKMAHKSIMCKPLHVKDLLWCQVGFLGAGRGARRDFNLLHGVTFVRVHQASVLIAAFSLLSVFLTICCHFLFPKTKFTLISSFFCVNYVAGTTRQQNQPKRELQRHHQLSCRSSVFSFQCCFEQK